MPSVLPKMSPTSHFNTEGLQEGFCDIAKAVLQIKGNNGWSEGKEVLL